MDNAIHQLKKDADQNAADIRSVLLQMLRQKEAEKCLGAFHTSKKNLSPKMISGACDQHNRSLWNNKVFDETKPFFIRTLF